jgi:putative membrane protein (TIGR04086 family)
MRGVAIGAIISAPAGVVAAIVVDEAPGAHNPGWTGLLAFVVVLGLLAGATTAAFAQKSGTPLVHGMLASVVVYVGVEIVGLTRRTISHDPVDWSRVISSLLLSMVVGAVGGLLGNRLANRARGHASRA